jgi:hypothetical protein
MSHSGKLAGLVVGVWLLSAVSALADPVTFWNSVTVSAVTSGRPGPPGLLDIALVQAAVHDAVQVIEREFRPFHYSDRRRSGNPAAAVAAASHRVLVLLYPNQQAALDATYNTYLATNGLEGDPGLAVGEAAGAALHAEQYRPVLAVPAFFGRNEVGEWRSAVPMGFIHLAFSEPFTMKRIDQFRPQPPPPLRSTRYLRDYNEVKALGLATAHPNENTDVARFWSGNFIAQWNQTMRQLAEAHLTDISDSARMFALANLAAADAAMAVWESKLFYNYWRPDTAIVEGNNDTNPKTAGDGGWTPLLPTPPYPDYVSGANGLTGAFTGMLRQFFGTDRMNFTVRATTVVIDPEREYTSFSQAAEEVVEARILLGIHFRAADEEGRRLGERVARRAFNRFLRPLNKDRD